MMARWATIMWDLLWELKEEQETLEDLWQASQLFLFAVSL